MEIVTEVPAAKNAKGQQPSKLDQCFDGQIWRLEAFKDSRGNQHSIRAAVYARARRRGVAVMVQVRGQYVYVQVKPEVLTQPR